MATPWAEGGELENGLRIRPMQAKMSPALKPLQPSPVFRRPEPLTRPPLPLSRIPELSSLTIQGQAIGVPSGVAQATHLPSEIALLVRHGVPMQVLRQAARIAVA